MSKRPVRLAKQTNNDYPYNYLLDRVEEWCYNHSTLCLYVLLALLTALFVVLCFAICGVSAVESGAMRNFVNRGLV